MHVLDRISEEESRFFLYCRCDKESFEQIQEVQSVSETIACCSFVKLHDLESETVYRVEFPFPNEGNEGSSFRVLRQDGTCIRVWKPSPTLQPEDLPPGFWFSHRYLNLLYFVDDHGLVRYRNKYQQTIDPVVTAITWDAESMLLKGVLFIPDDVEEETRSARLKVVRFRNDDQQVSFVMETATSSNDDKVFGRFEKRLYQQFFQRQVLRFSCRIDCASVATLQGYCNFFVEYGEYAATLKNFLKALEKKDFIIPYKRSPFAVSLLVPYVDEAVNVLRMDIYRFSLIDFFRFRLLLRKCRKKQMVKDNSLWLIGEYNDTARDNGLHLFAHLRRNHRDINAWYVISQDSPDRDNLPRRHVVYYGSYHHFRLAMRAGVLVGSHFPSYLVPKIESITRYKKNYHRYKKVFLQHGVIAIKATAVTIYRKNLRYYDKFIASSEFERNTICRHLGYDKEEVAVTGLARWDHLLEIATKERVILVVPTWRDHLVYLSDNEFRRSSFHQFWSSLLNDNRLLQVAEKKGVRIVLSIHIGLARFGRCFDLPKGVILAHPKNLQPLLASCGALVTDYSSVAFDALLLKKPVVFCPFDYEDMVAKDPVPSFVNFEQQLPGPACYGVAEAVDSIIRVIHDDFILADEYLQRRKLFFAHCDRGNSARIVKEIRGICPT